ncbi:biotin--[acetyl-CoA-carboxylase] ligase [Acidobacterium sp. S8]|uniref:biotin--[acetyl-CoA-carboxylase] ligase n=1 Tax=Acidobacterium sp. S8 TaxID=1641854 RepID=UPI00131E2430|nr:biotin--[acetyl-CoA-carboxylase] ligase [Acidobacterium sp. S8]
MIEDAFDIPALDGALSGTPFAGKLQFFPSIHSTNTHAMQQAEAGAQHGSVYFADEQTAGRGRGAHAWSSPPGSGLYVSVLLRPRMAPADVLWLSLATGLAVRNAVMQTTTLSCDLRWPNDLLFGPRKFCGILTELNAEVTRVRHLVIGIGINVHQQQFPPELRNIATSLHVETGRTWPRQELLLTLLQSLHREVVALSDPANAAASRQSVLERVEKASSWVRGKQVHVEEMDGFDGLTEGLDARGFLQVRTAQGLRTVFSGGVREFKDTSGK